jgi:hypothetical protein
VSKIFASCGVTAAGTIATDSARRSGKTLTSAGRARVSLSKAWCKARS